MSFDDFSDQVGGHLIQEKGWTEIQVADFISPRTRRLIQAYQDGDSLAVAATTLLVNQTVQQYWD